MITHILAAIAFGLLLSSTSYRHTALLNKSKKGTALLISLVFAIFATGMAFVALIFSAAIKDSMFFKPQYAAIFILLLLALKAYFNTRRSKLAEVIFDIKSFGVMLTLALSNSFEAFLAFCGSGFLQPNLTAALIVSGSLSFLFMLFGFEAGKRPNSVTSIRIFIFFASAVYLLASISAILYFFI